MHPRFNLVLAATGEDPRLRAANRPGATGDILAGAAFDLATNVSLTEARGRTGAEPCTAGPQNRPLL
ncbi:hypothetical protein NGR_b07460 (plasmid) [Sinorhizobium fredii NGR234]|uniref:Uncharacterized protein n=1 Tax=Sinorhizobium fredii (strain NBRC 101917 / NGR234) TaxID=394 RepID=C3KQ46_SINFN|nr:hypothetical protein NGR_b07460 [Sinorhizobium fredii NGR234]